jgi:hypothetical protein
MGKKQSEARQGDCPGEPAKCRLTDDWPIYAAFLPMVVIVIGIGATIFFGATSWSNPILPNAASTESGPEAGYLQGLARLRTTPHTTATVTPVAAPETTGSVTPVPDPTTLSVTPVKVQTEGR